jgi:hypothetical protein
MKEKPYLTAAEEAAEIRLEEEAEDRKWWREHGGTDSDSDRAGDAYEAEIGRWGGA